MWYGVNFFDSISFWYDNSGQGASDRHERDVEQSADETHAEGLVDRWQAEGECLWVLLCMDTLMSSVLLGSRGNDLAWIRADCCRSEI